MKLVKCEAVVSLADKVREETENIHGAVRMAALSGMTAVMVSAPTVLAYAAEGSGSSGSNVLEGEVWNAVMQGFGNLAVTFTAIIAIGAVTGLTIAATAAGARFAIKYIKGLLSNAA